MQLEVVELTIELKLTFEALLLVLYPPPHYIAFSLFNGLNF